MKRIDNLHTATSTEALATVQPSCIEDCRFLSAACVGAAKLGHPDSTPTTDLICNGEKGGFAFLGRRVLGHCGIRPVEAERDVEIVEKNGGDTYAVRSILRDGRLATPEQ